MNSNNRMLKVKPFVFYFSFITDKHTVTKSFIVNELGMGRLLKGEYTVRSNELYNANPDDHRNSPFNIFLNDYYDRYCAEIESEFGTHDFAASPVKQIDSIGQYTFEVDLDHADSCMERHRAVFVALAGADCVSCVVDVSNPTGTDLDVYNETIHVLYN